MRAATPKDRMTTRTMEQSSAAEKASNPGFSLISNEKLLQLYALMVKCRMIAERARILLMQSKSAGMDHAALGHEAAIVGVANDLLPADTIVPSEFDFTVSFIKGAPLENLFRSLFLGEALPNLAARLDFVTRVAMRNKTERKGGIAVAFLSNVPSSLGLWQKSLAKATAQHLPILFVRQSSLLVEPLSLKANSPASKIDRKELSSSLPCIAVDGKDVVAVYRVATEAIAHARRGNGPTLIESTIESGMADDPILKMERYLARQSLFSQGMKLVLTARFTQELDAAVVAAQASPLPQNPKPAQMAWRR